MARDVGVLGLLLTAVASAVVTLGAFTASPGEAPSSGSALEPRSLARAHIIRDGLDARYRVLPGRGLAVTEATSTGVVESFALLTPDLLTMRVIPAANGIYYAICPLGATCPYPTSRFARPATDFSSRRMALELALRTFLDTTVDLVVVSLPTPRFTVLAFERDELMRAVNVPSLAKALSGDRSRPISASLLRLVNQVTRARVFAFLGIEPTPNGWMTWTGVPLWPSAGDVPADANLASVSGSDRPRSASTAWNERRAQ